MAARGADAVGRARLAYWRDTLAADCRSVFYYFYKLKFQKNPAFARRFLRATWLLALSMDDIHRSVEPGRCETPVSHKRGVHSHESQEFSCWSPCRWLLRRNVHAHDESWERASGPKSREGHGDIEGRDGEIGRAQGRGNRSDSRQDDPGVVFWPNQGEQRLHDCRQGQG